MATPFLNPKKRSAAQKAAARTNGAKSSGPVTAEGKQISSQNAVKHGLRSADPSPYLPGENPDYLPRLLDSLVQEWQPSTPTQAALVELMAESLVQHQRREEYYYVIMEERAADLDADDPVPEAGRRRRNAEAYQELAESSSILEVLRRDQAQYLRRFHQAERTLRLYKDRERKSGLAAA